MPSSLEWSIIAIIGLIVIAVNPPTPHWRQTRCEPCHLCGNCRRIVHRYRWWRFASETIEPTFVRPTSEAHEHVWWEYSRYYISYDTKCASGKSSIYQDGRQAWRP
jgi:hypothetical protein